MAPSDEEVPAPDDDAETGVETPLLEPSPESTLLSDDTPALETIPDDDVPPLDEGGWPEDGNTPPRDDAVADPG